MNDLNNIEGSVLIIDDDKQNLFLLEQVLIDEKFTVYLAENGMLGLELAETKQPDVILLDLVLPGANGIEICKIIKETNSELKYIEIIILTAKTSITDKIEALKLGADDYLTKPFNISELVTRIKTHINLSQSKKLLIEKKNILGKIVNEKTADLIESRLEIIEKLSRAAEYRDPENKDHSIRIAKYSSILSEASNFSPSDCLLILNAAVMHDVGKVGIPDHILLKPGKLTHIEFELMKTHCEIGGKILGGSRAKLIQMASSIAMTHHEKFDGSGYPFSLKGDEIPYLGQIVGLCDVFDALTSNRPYKRAWPIDKSVQEINNESGEHFNPKLIKVFNQTLPELLKIQKTKIFDSFK